MPQESTNQTMKTTGRTVITSVYPWGNAFHDYTDKHESENPCILCGRPTSGSSEMVWASPSIGQFLAAKDAPDLPFTFEAGLYHIGRNCLKKHPELKDCLEVRGS